MAKYINKEELIKALDSYDKYGCMPDGRIAPFRELVTPQEYIPYVHYDDVVNAVVNMPTIDIVHCGECCFYPKCDESISLDQDWFCADAIRRD